MYGIRNSTGPNWCATKDTTEEIATTTSINLKLESSETLETTEKAEITTFINDKLTISKPKLLNLKHMKPKVVEGTQQIHQEDIKGLLTNRYHLRIFQQLPHQMGARLSGK